MDGYVFKTLTGTVLSDDDTALLCDAAWEATGNHFRTAEKLARRIENEEVRVGLLASIRELQVAANKQQCRKVQVA